MTRWFLTITLISYVSLIYSQEKSNNWVNKLEKYQLQPILGLQLWSTYTLGMEIFDIEEQTYTKVQNRINTQLRRSRLGIKGMLNPNLKFNFITSLDLVGKDNLSGTDANGNNGSSPNFRIWNAYVQWKIRPKSDAIHLSIGYLPPQIGRESINSALRSTSIEKSWSQNYLRHHLTGTGPGRVMGLNLGGVFPLAAKQFKLGYDFGLFNPVFQSDAGNSSGRKSTPLLVGRIVVHIGDAEQKKYTLSHKVNYFSTRQGLSVALSGAHQGNTDLYDKNYVVGGDFLLNWNHFNFDGEWTLLRRLRKTQNPRLKNDQLSVNSNTGYVRMSYNIHLKNQWVLEPCLMFMQFNGAMDTIGQTEAKLLSSHSGRDHNLDIGGNLYFNPDLKLSLHYTFRDGEIGDIGPGASINNYFYQAGIGAIKRGEWLGIGLVTML